MFHPPANRPAACRPLRRRSLLALLPALLAGLGSCQEAPSAPGATEDGRQDTAMGACAKADSVWNEYIVPSRYLQLPPLTDVGLGDFLRILDPSFAVQALTHDGDTMPPGRRKRIHAYGAEARLRLQALGGHPYSGLFADGSDCLIGRFSLADRPTASTSIPALAIKIYVDGAHPSVNLHLMHSVDGQTGHDFFANDLSNVLPPATSYATRLLERSFRSAAETLGVRDSNPGRLTLDHVAAIHGDGTSVAVATAPYRIVLHPTEAARSLMPDASADSDFRRQLARLAPGTVLYDVYAYDAAQPHDDAGKSATATATAGQHIGRLLLLSPVISSRYGDETLYFQHHMQQTPH